MRDTVFHDKWFGADEDRDALEKWAASKEAKEYAARALALDAQKEGHGDAVIGQIHADVTVYLEDGGTCLLVFVFFYHFFLQVCQTSLSPSTNSMWALWVGAHRSRSTMCRWAATKWMLRASLDMVSG